MSNDYCYAAVPIATGLSALPQLTIAGVEASPSRGGHARRGFDDGRYAFASSELSGSRSCVTFGIDALQRLDQRSSRSEMTGLNGPMESPWRPLRHQTLIVIVT